VWRFFESFFGVGFGDEVLFNLLIRIANDGADPLALKKKACKVD
jgi:hypothetical protein